MPKKEIIFKDGVARIGVVKWDEGFLLIHGKKKYAVSNTGEIAEVLTKLTNTIVTQLESTLGQRKTDSGITITFSIRNGLYQYPFISLGGDEDDSGIKNRVLFSLASVFGVPPSQAYKVPGFMDSVEYLAKNKVDKTKKEHYAFGPIDALDLENVNFMEYDDREEDAPVQGKKENAKNVHEERDGFDVKLT